MLRRDLTCQEDGQASYIGDGVRLFLLSLGLVRVVGMDKDTGSSSLLDKTTLGQHSKQLFEHRLVLLFDRIDK